MIEAEKLVKFYGEKAAVRDITFSIGKGEIVGLLGPNGAGKTTTMRMLTTYLPADGGKATVAGFDIADKPMEVRKRLGYLPETVPLYNEMPVNAYLDFMAKIRGVPSKGRKRRIEEVMEMCRIADVSGKIISKLSRGYRQRVGIAQAIVHNPQVIILDEPTVGLDPRQIQEIRKVIRDLAENHTVVLSTHILPEVNALCDRVIIVNRGRVLVDDTLENLEKRNSDTERVQLELRAPQEAAQVFLEEFPGVALAEQIIRSGDDERLDTTGEIHQFMLEVNQGQDVREKLAQAIISKSWGILELKLATPTLEEIFVRLINEDLAQLADEDGVEASGATETDDELDTPEPVVSRKLDISDDEMDEPAAGSSETAKENTRKAAPSFLKEETDSDSAKSES